MIDIYIGIGAENAITNAGLAACTDLSERQIRQRIQKLRKQGRPIISSSGGGYFYPSNDDAGYMQAIMFIRMMEAQAKSRFISIKPVKDWLERAGKQITMEELY